MPSRNNLELELPFGWHWVQQRPAWDEMSNWATSSSLAIELLEVAIEMPTQLFWHSAPKDYPTLNELEQFKSVHGFFWQSDVILNSKYC